MFPLWVELDFWCLEQMLGLVAALGACGATLFGNLR